MDYDELRKQKLQQLQKRQQEEHAQAEAEAKINSVVRSLLTTGAMARLGNVGLVNKELYLRAVQSIMYLQRAGQLPGKLQEEELKLLLDKLRDKRQITIKRK